MILAVASGKGGTGKTTVSAALAMHWGSEVTAVDLDVEEPNLHLFLKPRLDSAQDVFMEVPSADESRCTACGACADICQFKAITVMAGILLTFPEMCHGCGGCLSVCPEAALTPGARLLGEVVRGRWANGPFLMGRLRVGEAMSPPLMREVKARVLSEGRDVIMDSPPGVSCPAVNAVMDADAILLVTEPTPFGLHDLALAVEAFRPFGSPMGVVVNRAGLGSDKVYDYCREEGLPVLAEIPFDRSAAERYARGDLVTDGSDALAREFIALAEKVRNLASGAGKEAA